MTETLSSAEATARYTLVADAFETRLFAVTGQAWQVPSPCPDWTARDVAVHVFGVHNFIVGMAGGEAPPVPGPDDDPTEFWSGARQAVLDLLANPELTGTMIETPFGEMTAATLAGTALIADITVHTWDLARATNQDEKLDPRLVRAALEFYEPREHLMRGGMFDAAIEPAPGADEQTRLLNYCGREV
jgi:uncharacterized protein (TIGR03086 family)